MATKKSAIVLKDQKVSDMVAAGIDIKLTKMEIADYIAAKSKEELENRQNTLRDLIGNYMHKGVVVDMTKQQKVAADALKAVTGKDVFVMACFAGINSGYCWTGWFVFKNNNNDDRHSYTHIIQFQLDSSQIPDIDVESLLTEQNENWKRIQDLGKKKHRTLLVEQILSGSDSGKKVLADLTDMVQRAVHGDKALDK